MKTFQDGAYGIEYFVGDNNREKLLALLRTPAAVDLEAQRAAAVERAHAQVDAAQPFAAMTTRAERVIREGATHFALVDRQRADLKQEKFGAWHAKQEEAYAGTLIAETSAFDADGARALAAFPRPGLAEPATVVGAVNRDTKMEVFADATPDDAEILVDDAIVRDDAPFLALASIAIRGFMVHRNAYKDGTGTAVAERMLEKIAAAAPPDAEAARYVASKVEAYRGAWGYIVRVMLDKGGLLDPAHRATGALAPLLEPTGSALQPAA